MPNNLVTAAIELRKKGDNRGAISLLRQHISECPDDLIATHNLAAALCDAGYHLESSDVAKHAIGKGLHKPQTFLVYARALANLSEHKKATSAYHEVLSLEPGNTEAHKELAQLIWMREGNYREALEPITRAIKSIPHSIQLKLLRAELAGQMGNQHDRYRWTKQCFDSSDNSAAMHFYMSKAALATSRFDNALEHAKVAYQAFPNDLGCCIHTLNCLLASAKPSDALQMIERLRINHPRDQHLIALQATCWRLLNDDRYHQFYDYENFVKQLPLGVPKGWSNLEQYISDLETELEEAHSYKEHPFFLSVRHGSQLPSITASSKPAMKSYADAAAEPLRQYLLNLPKGDNPLQFRNTGRADLLSSWSVKLHQQGYHVNHVHQEGWISSACHIRLAKNSGNADEKAGWLKLGEPGPICSPRLKADHYVKPERGMMVIFPSYIWHGTVAFPGDTNRLTVAADFQPA